MREKATAWTTQVSPHVITSVLLRRELIGSSGGTNESIRGRGLLESREEAMMEVEFASAVGRWLFESEEEVL